MKGQFEMFESYRMLASEQLVNILTRGEKIQQKAEKDLFLHEGESDFLNVISKLTPARKKVAMAAVELYKRSRVRIKARPQIVSSSNIFSIMNPILVDLPNEEFWVLFLNNGLRLINYVRVSVGGYMATCADVRLILKKALDVDAAAIALVHNHPSGVLQPSREDDKLTETIREAARIMSIKVVDHVIIGNDNYYSYSDEGKM